jgi:hypothetical protein
VDVQGTRNVDAAASADVLLNFELPSDGSAAIFGACVLVGPITNATTGESLDPLPSQSVRREQEGELGLTDDVDDDVGGLCGDSANSTGIPVLANLSAATAVSLLAMCL